MTLEHYGNDTVLWVDVVQAETRVLNISAPYPLNNIDIIPLPSPVLSPPEQPDTGAASTQARDIISEHAAAQQTEL